MVWMMARLVISLIKVEGSGVEICEIQKWIKREKRRFEHDHMQ
jgi:hypothetical protein